jgi:predicted transcriptional regulator
MKYNVQQLKRIKDKEILLSGEFQKSVWSIIRREGKVRSKDVSIKIGRGNDQVHNIIQKLIEYNMVEKEARGVYSVSKYIKEGVL